MVDNPRIEELRRRVQKDPASIAFAQLAEEYRRSGNYDDSVDVCRAGLERHPSYLSARVTLGRALIELERFDEAEAELNVVLQSAPENLAAIRGLAEIHQRRGDLGEALKQYQSALGIAKHDPDIEESVHQLSRQLGAPDAGPSPAAAPPHAESEPPPIPIDIPFVEGLDAVTEREASVVPSTRKDSPTSPGLEAAADEFTKALEALSELSLDLPESPLPGASLDFSETKGAETVSASEDRPDQAVAPDPDSVAQPISDQDSAAQPFTTADESAPDDVEPPKPGSTVLGRLQSWLSAIVSDREARAGSR